MLSRKIRLPFVQNLVVGAVGLSMVLSMPATGDDGRDAKNPAEAAVNWTLLLVNESCSPQLFQGSENKFNLAYELFLNNVSQSEMNLEKVEIIDAEKKSVVKVLSGKGLADLLLKYDKTKTSLLKAGQNVVLFVNAEFDNASDCPNQMAYRITYKTLDFDKHSVSKVVDYNGCKVNKKPVVVISPPFKGGKWIAFGGYAGVAGHRRAIFGIDNNRYCAQRFAIDWISLDKDNYSVKGDSSKVENSSCYGQSLYAVADGTVVGVNQGFENQAPYKTVTGKDRINYPGGNSIVIDIGKGTPLYAFYAHLKPGSIKIKKGDLVTKGQEIAQLGNTGNTSGPHLHFHVVDNPHILGSNGVPYVFDKFTVVGEVPDLNKFFANDEKGLKQTIKESKFNGEHKEQLVREGHIIQCAD